MVPRIQLGGFREAADTLTVLAGHRYTRQGVQQMWKRRRVNGFPDLTNYLINGYPKSYFCIAEVTDWYSFAEAADLLTMLEGKRRTPSNVYNLWIRRGITGFPARIMENNPEHADFGRLKFSSAEITRWYETQKGLP